MSRELRIPLGVLAEKRRPSSQWAQDYWIPTAVIEGHLNHHEGDLLYEAEGVKRYFLGYSEIYCHASETEAYIHNFESTVPAIYVILRKDDENLHPLDWFVHCVTVSPYLAQDFSDSDEDVVERVSMPLDIAKQLIAFIDAHHVLVQPREQRLELRVASDAALVGGQAQARTLDPASQRRVPRGRLG